MRINMLESINQGDIRSQPFFDRFPSIRFYHGTMNEVDDVQELPFKLRTKPKDTNKQFHDIINNLSTERFGIPIRNLLFAYIDKGSAGIYGNVFVIIPKGDFKVYYHPDINDMTIDLSLDNHVTIIDDVVFAALDDLENDELVNHLSKDEIDYWFHHAEKHTRYKRVNNAYEVIDEVLSTSKLSDDVQDDIMSFLKQRVKHYIPVFQKKLAKKYLDKVEEITTESQLNYNQEPELMIYAPNGFYAIPLEDYEDEYEI